MSLYADNRKSMTSKFFDGIGSSASKVCFRRLIPSFSKLSWYSGVSMSSEWYVKRMALQRNSMLAGMVRTEIIPFVFQ